MSYRLIIPPLAEEDIRDAAFWYNTEREGLGQDFLVALSEKLLLVEQNPHQYLVRYGTIRAVQLHRFPYLVYYRIAGQTVRVLAVLHAKRDPGTAGKRR